MLITELITHRFKSCLCNHKSFQFNLPPAINMPRSPSSMEIRGLSPSDSEAPRAPRRSPRSDFPASVATWPRSRPPLSARRWLMPRRAAHSRMERFSIPARPLQSDPKGHRNCVFIMAVCKARSWMFNWQTSKRVISFPKQASCTMFGHLIRLQEPYTSCGYEMPPLWLS